MDSTRELQGRVALVTGAGSGIGRATARLLAAQGARVGLFGRTEDELREIAREIQAAGGQADVLVGDVTKADEVRARIDELVDRAGGLHAVFANAGVNGVWAPIEELKLEDWQSTIAINLTGTFLTIKLAVPHMRRAGGAIVVCASVNGTRIFSNSGASAYATSKAGQVALAKMLAVELARSRIRVNVICPGAIDTEIEENTERRDLAEVKVPVSYPRGSIPLTGREPGRAEQVADLVLFLTSDRSSHITGTEVWIDGGQSLVEG
jgi:NAD(P)-dependent dehydrogenase (short-subunit alcohol dehydrogenase family)